MIENTFQRKNGEIANRNDMIRCQTSCSGIHVQSPRFLVT